MSNNPLKKLWDSTCERAWAEGSVIKQAPFTFAFGVMISGAAVSGIAWKAIDALYQERIAVLQATIRNLEDSKSPTVGRDVRHLKPKQRARLMIALQLAPDEHFNFQINSIPNCEECEDFAQELRVFFGSMRGWGAGGGVLIFPYPTAMREGVHMTVDINVAPTFNKRLISAFDSANIPVFASEPEKLASGDIQGIILVGKAQ